MRTSTLKLLAVLNASLLSSLAFAESGDRQPSPSIDITSSISLDREMSDLNADGRVDGLDLSLLLASWGNCNDKYSTNLVSCSGDFNHDQQVDIDDLIVLLSNWS